MRLRPDLLKYLFGHHILNGLAVAVGVFLVALAGVFIFGFHAGMALASGALCVSIADTSTPFAAKLRILPLALICAALPPLALAFANGAPLLEMAVVIGVGFCSGLLVALGRWAIPVSILAQLAMVFALGSPATNFAERLDYALFSALGGAAYIPIALALTRATDSSGRRLTLAEVLREFAVYLRKIAEFYRADADEGAVCLDVVEHQASFADHLQTARSLIVSAVDRAEATRLIAALATVLDAFDGMVSTLADHAPLRLARAPSGLAGDMARLLLQVADDVDALALQLMLVGSKLEFPGREPALDAFSQKIAQLEKEGGVDFEILRAARLTRARVALAISHLSSLPAILSSREAAEASLAGVDFRAFATPLRLSFAPIRQQLRFNSPIFLHALRLTLALACGYALILLVPGLRHGNWILLTIAVIMRSSYGATRQRRDERLLGSVVGCGVAALFLALGSPTALVACQLGAIWVTHAFVKVDYRLTAIGATVMALLGLHLIDPVEAPPVAARLVDTVLGAGLVVLFSFIRPQFEALSAPKISAGFLAALGAYADRALRWDSSEQHYRLARKALMEAFWALGESAARMRADPREKRNVWPRYSRLIAASYIAAAQIVTVRLIIRHRRDELDPAAARLLLDETRAAALAELDLAGARAARRLSSGAQGDQLFEALRQRCDEVLREARNLRHLARGEATDPP